MRYHISIIFILMVILLFANGCNNTNIELVKSESYFNDFYVKDDKVYIECELTIKNPVKTKKEIKINALLKEDVKLGLLVNEVLNGYNEELLSDKFILKTGMNSITVIFVGEFAGTTMKNDRNLPVITIEEIY